MGSIALGEPLLPADPEISLRIYYAQAGEELFAIARRFHVSPAQMLAAYDLAEGTTAIDAPRRLLVPGAGGCSIRFCTSEKDNSKLKYDL